MMYQEMYADYLETIVSKQTTRLINRMCESGEWPMDFAEVIMIALTKKPEATKCSDHRTISVIAYPAKTVESLLRR